jgi:hypothetical protein
MVAFESADHDDMSRVPALHGLTGILSVRSLEILPYHASLDSEAYHREPRRCTLSEIFQRSCSCRWRHDLLPFRID